VSTELDHLWALRDLDEEIARLGARLGNYPAQRGALEERVNEDRVRLERVKKQIVDVQMRRRTVERETEQASAEEKKFQSQLPAVKKNEEYQALLHEIASCRSRRSDLETQVLEHFEEEERLAAARPAIETALRAAESERDAKLAEIQREEATALGLRAARSGEREKVLDGLSAGTRARYERVHASREGRAVVPIVKGACGGCYRAQPPQLLQEARKRDRLLVCEGCGRLLVYPPEGAAV